MMPICSHLIEITRMNETMQPSLLALPIELTYRILDQLKQVDILLSVRNVCTRLNAIVDTYHRYQVTRHLTLNGARFTRHVPIDM